VRNGSAHACTAPHVVIEGDRATATHYGTLFTRRDGQFVLVRLTASRWELRRFEGKGWRVMKRTNRLLDGSEPARRILSKVQQPPSRAGGE
ncbi:MAG: nuclear transport factor 2 family protein, partial [Ramlibacter sp.]|nr:nuclear transport factor 2 family protein [Ramlibacter sp.]